MWDVAVERQIQVKGPDAAAFVDMLITRDVHSLLRPMQARYVILCNQYGGLINDPVLLRVVGFEIYLHDAMLHADDVWPCILEQGREFNLGVIAPSHIRRLEAGILSYGQGMDVENNPYEVRLGWQGRGMAEP